MIPYIVINGNISNNITGLIIQKLPPISKPKRRTQIEEIDGRDGDIVTTLGYSAYDKDLTIGLHGDYNIDDIISYFDSSGQITFSNEPDKYYDFAIYDQINFEKLIRFKTATVKLHVQPFKYSESETAIVKTYDNNNINASITVRNNGNIYSKPTLQITGKGNIDVNLNGTQIFNITLSSAEYETIIINSVDLNAYSLSGDYLNRKINGDYDNLKLNVGNNNVTINGNVTNVTINNYSRWI